jgi:hypothetical protein
MRGRGTAGSVDIQRSRREVHMTRASTWGRSTRWSLFGVMFALVLVASSARAEDETDYPKCSDLTENDRPCTATEQYTYCVIIAVESFDDCWEDSGIIGKIGCALAYEADYAACALALPINGILSVTK